MDKKDKIIQIFSTPETEMEPWRMWGLSERGVLYRFIEKDNGPGWKEVLTSPVTDLEDDE